MAHIVDFAGTCNNTVVCGRFPSLTFLVLNIVKTEVITGAGQGGVLSSGITR